MECEFHHYRALKSPQMVIVLNQMHPVHFSCLRLGLPSGLFPSDFPTKMYTFPRSSE